MAKRAGRAVGVCMCEREDGEGLQRRTKRRSSLAGRVGTRPGTKEAWLAFSLLSLKLTMRQNNKMWFIPSNTSQYSI